MTAQAFCRTVAKEGGPIELGEAKRVSAAVMHALRDRLTPREAATSCRSSRPTSKPSGRRPER